MSKEIGELILPDDVRYSKTHEWGKIDNANIIAGISDYAQSQLGDVVFVELPELASRFNQGDVFGTVESVKAVSELYMPVAGEVIRINDALADSPGLVNEQPYKAGWMIEIKPDAIGEFDTLMDKTAYMELLKGIQK